MCAPLFRRAVLAHARARRDAFAIVEAQAGARGARMSSGRPANRRRAASLRMRLCRAAAKPLREVRAALDDVAMQRCGRCGWAHGKRSPAERLRPS